jgi:hypothetical protein
MIVPSTCRVSEGQLRGSALLLPTRRCATWLMRWRARAHKVSTTTSQRGRPLHPPPSNSLPRGRAPFSYSLGVQSTGPLPLLTHITIRGRVPREVALVFFGRGGTFLPARVHNTIEPGGYLDPSGAVGLSCGVRDARGTSALFMLERSNTLSTKKGVYY